MYVRLRPLAPKRQTRTPINALYLTTTSASSTWRRNDDDKRLHRGSNALWRPLRTNRRRFDCLVHHHQQHYSTFHRYPLINQQNRRSYSNSSEQSNGKPVDDNPTAFYSRASNTKPSQRKVVESLLAINEGKSRRSSEASDGKMK